tara:strand:- start:43 stop:648 length:606 start_codon:yes stop_codon:yes gene_type:complete
MYWSDQGFLLSKNNFDENSIIIEAFTSDHGKCIGIVYGGASRKQKKNFQIGNKILVNWRSKGENKMGYFTIELLKPISPLFFDDKKKSICILAASSILKILLPERQINKKIYTSFEQFLNKLDNKNWIEFYIDWELKLIKELGYKTPDAILKKNGELNSSLDVSKSLKLNKKLFMENFIMPNNLRLPLSRNILEKYFNNSK